MFPLDTVVLSELRKRRRDANVVAWIGSVSEADLYMSVASIVEIDFGIERKRKNDPAFAEELAREARYDAARLWRTHSAHHGSNREGAGDGWRRRSAIASLIWQSPPQHWSRG